MHAGGEVWVLLSEALHNLQELSPRCWKLLGAARGLATPFGASIPPVLKGFETFLFYFSLFFKQTAPWRRFVAEMRTCAAGAL